MNCYDLWLLAAPIVDPKIPVKKSSQVIELCIINNVKIILGVRLAWWRNKGLEQLLHFWIKHQQTAQELQNRTTNSFDNPSSTTMSCCTSGLIEGTGWEFTDVFLTCVVKWCPLSASQQMKERILLVPTGQYLRQTPDCTLHWWQEILWCSRITMCYRWPIEHGWNSISSAYMICQNKHNLKVLADFSRSLVQVWI